MNLLRTFAQIAPLSFALSCAVSYPEAEGLTKEVMEQIRARVAPLVTEHLDLNRAYHEAVPTKCSYTLEECPELDGRITEFNERIFSVQAEVGRLLVEAGCTPQLSLANLTSFSEPPNFGDTPEENATRYWVKVANHLGTPDCQKVDSANASN